MRGLKGWKIARIRGVDLKIHISLLFILLYVVLIASAQFPLVVRDAELDMADIAGGPLMWGGIFAFALFSSVVLHEFGHVIMAQSLGVKVNGVTLMMLGGVSEMEQIPEKRYHEFKVAIVGPIVSLGIAGALFLVERYSMTSELVLFSYWLGRVNLVLAIFNLLPAFPLDGGRAMRSVLAARQGTLRATRTAVRFGKWFAVAFGIMGFLQFNILLMLIALFLYAAAQNELLVLVTRDALKGIRAGDVALRTEPVAENATLSSAADQMKYLRTTVLPVSTLSGAPAIVGIDSLKRVPHDHWHFTRVRDVMDANVKTARPQEQLADLLPELMRSPARALPLEDGGRIVGVVRYSDVDEISQLRTLENDDRRNAA